MFKHIFVYVFILYQIFNNDDLKAQHYSFRSYGLEEGLPQSEVWDMLSDKRGYFWVATNGGGLARFNGRHFQVFTKKHGLIDEQPRTLFEDSKGNLWIITFRGLSIYNGRAFVNYTEQDGIINCTNAQIFEDRQGHIWIYLFQNQNTRAFLRYANGKFENMLAAYSSTFENNLPAGIFLDRQGIMYALTQQKGLLQFQNNSWIAPTWTQLDTLKQKPVIAPLYHDKQDRLWVTATTFQAPPNEVGLYYLKNNIVKRIDFPNFPSSTIVHIREDRQGDIWITSQTRGVVCLKPDGSHIHYHQDNGLISNFLNTSAEDLEGNNWFASRGNGIIRFDKGRFIAFNEDAGVQRAMVRSIFEDKQGTYWLGTAGGGFSSYDGKAIKAYFVNDATLGRIKSIDTTEAGKILFASDAGLLELNGESYRIVSERYGLPANAAVSYIYKATIKNEKVWFFATFNQGIYVYNPKEPNKATNYQVNNSAFKSNYIHSITQDAKGIVWISSNAGLVRYEKGILKNFGKAEGLLNALIIQACPDKWGNLWLATYGEGIACFDGKTFKHITPANSNIASSVIYSLILDNDNNMWAGTQKGVDKITFDKKGNILKIKNYDHYDGFSGLECNGAANFKDSKGNLWFGAIKGALRYNPEEDKPNTIAPIINITDIRLFFRPVAWAGKEYKAYHAGLSDWFGLPTNLILPYSKNHISFDFEAISFQASEKVRYSWKLEGLDADWSPESDKTEAVYPNLPAKTYTFYVKAMNNEGIWSKPIAYTFTVLPPWYQTWWATILFLFVIVAIITAGVRWRINALKAYQKHLEKQVAEKTAEVVEQNAILQQQKEEITIQAENLQEANQEISKRQQEITDSITYAKRIQDAILPQILQIQELLPNSFILFRPRDIVSGDFYWFAEVEPFRNQGFKLQTSYDKQDFELVSEFTKPKGKIVVAAADCTGHGVPGAFMSMIGNELLHEIVIEKNITSPDQILYFLHARIRQALKQSESSNRDGMDISICLIDRDKQVLEYAGARSRMLYIQQGEMHDLKGDKFAIGGEQREIERVFTKHTISLVVTHSITTGQEIEYEIQNLPTTLYLFSDGYIDQFGGKERKKFRISQFRDLLLANQDKNMQMQQTMLENALDAWIQEGGEAQIDDVMVIGIRI